MGATAEKATSKVGTPETKIVSEEQSVTGSGHANAIKKLLANGAKRLSGVKVKNVNFTEKDNYTMVSFTLGTKIPGFVTDDNGATYKEGLTPTLFTSLFAITGAIKEDEDLAWMGNALLDKPEAVNLIFNGGTVDIIQQTIPAGEEYVNPFSTRDDAEAVVYDHDIVINNIVKFHLGKTGLRMADKLADKMLGF